MLPTVAIKRLFSAFFTYADVGIDNATAATIGHSEIEYYAIPFTLGGITLRLDVSEGHVYCYVSDTVRNPAYGNNGYQWYISTAGGYADRFIDPTEYGRSETRYIYVAVRGSNSHNTYLMTSVSGNFSSQSKKALIS